MKYARTLLAAVVALAFSTAAYAQNQTVKNHAFAVGKGPGVSGYTSLLCGSAQLAVGQAAADPICVPLSGDATLSAAGALTLATVNSNVGSFGSATQCAVFTVNGKGLLTAASGVTCTPAVGSLTGTGTGVIGALGANLNASGGIISPTPVRAGDLVYWNGSAWVQLSGNNSGTTILQETSAGVPSWVPLGTLNSVTPGTGVAAVLAVNLNASGGIVSPTPTRAGDIIYWNGTTWVTLAGNNSGTNFLQENASGVPSWVAASGTGTVTTLTAGAGIALSSGATCTTTCTVTIAQPYFLATLSASQTVSTGVTTKVQFNQKPLDSNGWYDNVTNFRFTPLLAGKYSIDGVVQCSGSTVSSCVVALFKNGTEIAFSSSNAANTSTAIDLIVSMNGTTDFLELDVINTCTGTCQVFFGSGSIIGSWFEGKYISP